MDSTHRQQHAEHRQPPMEAAAYGRHDLAETQDDALFWERLYRERPPVQSPRVNPLLEETVAPLDPGAALDLGCGAGGDALWLAERGWQVTAVDLSPTAVARVRERADERGLGARLAAERHDLAEGFPAGRFDLVSAQYFHTPFALPRARVLRAAAESLRPGGLLLVVDHGSTAPWSWNQDPDVYFPTPREVADELALEPRRLTVLRAETPTRLASGPDGQTATVVDHVLLVQAVPA